MALKGPDANSIAPVPNPVFPFIQLLVFIEDSKVSDLVCFLFLGLVKKGSKVD